MFGHVDSERSAYKKLSPAEVTMCHVTRECCCGLLRLFRATAKAYETGALPVQRGCATFREGNIRSRQFLPLQSRLSAVPTTQGGDLLQS